jgi:hypothetical protein
MNAKPNPTTIVAINVWLAIIALLGFPAAPRKLLWRQLLANAASQPRASLRKTGTLPTSNFERPRIWLVRRTVLAAAAVFCLGLIVLLYGFGGAGEALKSILVGTGLVQRGR